MAGWNERGSGECEVDWLPGPAMSGRILEVNNARTATNRWAVVTSGFVQGRPGFSNKKNLSRGSTGLCCDVVRAITERAKRALTISLLIAVSIAGCRSTHVRAQNHLVTIDTTVMEETPDFPITTVRYAFVHKDQVVLMGYEDDFIVIRSRTDGRILWSYILPPDLTDSLFPVHKNEVAELDGFRTFDGKPVHLLSRRRYSKNEQATRLHHRVNSVAYQGDSILIVDAEIAGIIENEWRGSHNEGPMWLRALLRIRLSDRKLLKVERLNFYPVKYMYTSSFVNSTGDEVVCGAVDVRWVLDKHRFKQFAMARYSISNDETTYFAERDSANIRFISEAPIVLWENDHDFFYSNGTDPCVYSRNDSNGVFRLPDQSVDGKPLHVQRRAVRGISEAGNNFCIYGNFLWKNSIRHDVNIYNKSTGTFLFGQEMRTSSGGIIYSMLDEADILALFIKAGDRVLKVRFSLR
jgi:hypothetical protein